MSSNTGEESAKSNHKVVRKQWRNNDMEDAMMAVAERKMTVTTAARSFKVPRKTLDDRIKGHVTHGKKPGVATVLSPEEESSLTEYLKYMANHGFPLTRTMVKAFAWAIAKRSGSDGRFNPQLGPGDHWWFLYKNRHPELALRRVDSLQRSRAEALNPRVVKEYFDLLNKTLVDNNLMNSPRQIYNCDETFMPLDSTREKAVTTKGAKNVYCQELGSSEHITVLCCASAAGIPHPPMIIYKKSFPGGAYRFDGPDDALYARSESGWIDSELFLVWLRRLFLKHVVQQRPVLLITDGHKSHMTLDVIDTCRDNNVILFCLPPHTTHALQPLDVSVFKSLKDTFSKAARAMSFAKFFFIISKREFSRVLKSPLDKSFSIPNIKAGFRKCGIYPFNPDAIAAAAKMVPSQLHNSNSDAGTYPLQLLSLLSCLKYQAVVLAL